MEGSREAKGDRGGRSNSGLWLGKFQKEGQRV